VIFWTFPGACGSFWLQAVHERPGVDLLSFWKIDYPAKNSTLTIKPALNNLNRVAPVELISLFVMPQSNLKSNSRISLNPILRSKLQSAS